MKSKATLFFTPADSVNCNHMQGSPLDEIKKYIDAQIEYNEILLKQLQESENKHEAFEIIVSNCISLSEMPQSYTLPNDDILEDMKQGFIGDIQRDIKVYEKLKAQLNITDIQNVDHLYLIINFAYQENKLFAFNTKPEGLKQIFSYVYGKDAAKKINRAIIDARSSKSPLLTEANTLKEMLDILVPYVSQHSQRFKDDAQITLTKNYSVSIALGESEHRPSIYKRLCSFLDKNPDNVEAQALKREYLEIIKVLNKTKTVSTDMCDIYRELFENLQAKYQIEDKITIFLRAIIQKKLLEQSSDTTKYTESQLIPSPITNTTVRRPDSTPHVSELHEKEQSSTSLSPILTQDELPKTTAEQIEPSLSPENPKVDIKNKHHLTKTNELDDFSTTSSQLGKEEEGNGQETREDQLGNEKEEKGLESNEKIDGEQSKSSYNDYQLFPKSKKKKARAPASSSVESKVENKHNTLNLNKEHQDTFRKIWSSKVKHNAKGDHETIDLRALISLLHKLGGTLETTGRNRTVLKIKNIYAHLLVPAEKVEGCNTASVKMHGGGHRSKRSQNSDSAAPGYLVEQTRKALERAGYTPVNLGLIDAQTTSETLVYQYNS
ncbi:hypothetical protein ACQUW5_05660 [Legionella sp. CNM-1927-20]|uniref:hypothetical protein n=1 Tax=Legionella sp. CNM-1927-20 TaxID=3422221 RepID=UPI00403B22F5